ncbi:MAG: hypothetical protein ACJAXZ_004348 [Akkermansiaceae bacterium]
MSSQKRAAAYKVSKARALLLTDESPDGPAFTDQQVVSKTGMILRTIERLRKRFHEVGPLEALEPIARTHVSRKPALDDDQEARLVQIACREPPPGWARWTLKLLAGKLVDEFAKQLVDHHPDCLPARPGSITKEDYEDVRRGSVTAFMRSAPLEGWREV